MPDWLAERTYTCATWRSALSGYARPDRSGSRLAIKFPLSKGVCLFGVAPGCAVRDD
jgi:hypothetical protein